MTTTKEQVTFTKYGGIYYTDQLTFTAGQGTLTRSKIVFTSNVDLQGVTIAEVTAKHLRPDTILIRNKV